MRLATTIAPAVLACAALLVGVRGAFAAPSELPPVEDYVRFPAIRDIAISPAGTHLAFAMAKSGGHAQLAVLDLTALGPAKLLAKFSDADVTNVHWVNNDRLVFGVARFEAAAYEQRTEGLLAINRDGSGQRELISIEFINFDASSLNMASRVLPWQWRFFDTVDDGSPDIIVSEHLYDPSWRPRSVLLSRLNTVSASRRSLSMGAPENTREWVLDGHGQPSVLATQKDGRAAIYWRGEPEKAWSPIAEFPAYGTEGFSPQFVDEKGQLHVLSRRDRDTLALYQFDPALKKMESEPTIALEGFDLQPAMVVNPANQRLLGVHVRMEQGGSYWFDKDLRKVQQSVDAAMPAGRVNRLWCGRCDGARFFVVESSSDREPGEYYLLDRNTWKLQFIASSRPWIKENSQGQRSFHRVLARDGLSLPVYLTRPAVAPAGQALPAVVLVHGGPYLRGHDLRWNAEAQFLASRGYLVIEVEFRGSAGYGEKHFRAGFKQWGLAMQDDLADAVAWAAKQGLADPARVCIMGASYGGYAALMGPIRNPDVYRCAISFAGVTDIDLMYDIHWSDFPEEWKQYGMPVFIGDRQKDAEQLKNTSPLQQVGRIKVPLLVAHGGLDQRVPIEHVRRFLAAAEKAGVQVEWASYPDEMHGFRKEANEADYLRRVEAFLARTLGGAAPTRSPPKDEPR